MSWTLTDWLLGAAGGCAAMFGLHLLWRRTGGTPRTPHDAMPLCAWPGVFVALALFGVVAFGGAAAGW